MLDPEKWVSALKLPTRIVVALAIVGAILLFTNDTVLSPLGVQGVVSTYRMWIGIGFLLCAAIAVVQLVIIISGYLKTKWKSRETQKAGHQALMHLTDSEKDVLRPFIKHRTKSSFLMPHRGEVHILEQADIIHKVHTNQLHGYATFVMTEWAWKYLNEHKDILDPSPELVQARLERIGAAWAVLACEVDLDKLQARDSAIKLLRDSGEDVSEFA